MVIEKGKISGLQMAIMMYPTILATAVLLAPAITGKLAKQDLWLSPVWASLIGILALYIAGRLNDIYPRETLIQYSEIILGKPAGKVIGFVFLFFYLHVGGLVIKEYSEFIIGNFLTLTPPVVVSGAMVLVCAFAVRGGLEVIARTAQFFVPIVGVLFLFLIILLLPDLEVKHMFPIMEKGVIPSVLGAIPMLSWFSEFVLVSFMLPFLSKRELGLKWGMIAVASVTLTMVVTNMAALFLFGDITAGFVYPFMSAARYISIADFLEHLESMVMAIWVGGTFVKVSVFYYVLALGTAQWLELRDYRPLVLPFGFLLILFGMWSAPNLQELSHFLGTSAPFYLVSVQIVIPGLLLLISTIRNR
jgi:spore germination protein KB